MECTVCLNEWNSEKVIPRYFITYSLTFLECLIVVILYVRDALNSYINPPQKICSALLVLFLIPLNHMKNYLSQLKILPYSR